MYLALKHLHLTCVAISIGFFVLRGIWMLNGSGMLKRKWVRVLPHIVDTLLLLSAIGLTIAISQYPFTHHWLTAKLAGLLAYILLGTIALKRGRTRGIRKLAFAGALISVGYILAVAVTHNAQPWLTL